MFVIVCQVSSVLRPADHHVAIMAPQVSDEMCARIYKTDKLLKLILGESQ